MSQAHVRDLRGSRADRDFDALLDGLPGLLSAAATQYVDLLRRSSRLVGGLMKPSDLASLNDCCAVPTQDCPPRCVAEIDWEACAGEAQRATVEVTNTSKQARDFAFDAGTLGPAKVEVAPPSAHLAPGQSVTVRLAVPGDAGFKEGETYRGELTVRGAYEQCVRLTLRVKPAEVPHLELSQGDPPQRITELKWYRHWQCTEPCVADDRKPQDHGGDTTGPR